MHATFMDDTLRTLLRSKMAIGNQWTQRSSAIGVILIRMFLLLHFFAS